MNVVRAVGLRARRAFAVSTLNAGESGQKGGEGQGGQNKVPLRRKIHDGTGLPPGVKAKI